MVKRSTPNPEEQLRDIVLITKPVSGVSVTTADNTIKHESPQSQE